jgi:hypothetical protein
LDTGSDIRESIFTLASKSFLVPKQPKNGGRWVIPVDSGVSPSTPMTSQPPLSNPSTAPSTGRKWYVGAHTHNSMAVPVQEIFTPRGSDNLPAKSQMIIRMTGVPLDSSKESRKLDKGPFYILIEGLIPPETNGKPVSSFGRTARYALAVDGVSASAFQSVFSTRTPSRNRDRSSRGTILDGTLAMDPYEPDHDFMWPDLSTVLRSLEPAVKKHWENHQRRVQRDAEASKARASASATATATATATVSTQLNAPTKLPISKASTSTRATKPPPNHLLD